MNIDEDDFDTVMKAARAYVDLLYPEGTWGKESQVWRNTQIIAMRYALIQIAEA